jgi:hypothetical protein
MTSNRRESIERLGSKDWDQLGDWQHLAPDADGLSR